MALQVPKDVWGIISQELGIRDLLSLRTTCTRLNGIVINMQARWFRAHQWFLAKNNQRKVKCAVRVHTARLSRHCIPFDYPYPGKLPTNGYRQRNEAHQKLIDDGTFQESDCKQSYGHWSVRVPKNELDIPLDKNFKPKRSNYIYYYLIECYRVKYPEHSSKKENLRRAIIAYKREISDCEHRIKRRREQIEQHERDLLKVDTEFKDNNIFDGYAVNSYKTPAGTSRKRGRAAVQTKK